MYDQGYGNEQAMYTMNRAAYGDIPAAMMSGGYGSAAAGGLQNMMADVGRVVMPVTYAPPARVNVGYYGTSPQEAGFFRSGMNAFGLSTVPRGTTALQMQYNAAGDFGERIGSGLAGAAATAGGLAFGGTIGSSVAGFAGAALGSVFGPVGTAVGGFLGANIGGYMLGASGAGQVSKAIEERRQVQNFLENSSFRFVGAGSSMVDPVLGAGMSREARRDMGEFIRGMDIRDKTLNMGDLSQILKQGSQLGLFNGTRDMEDFQRKFKEITESVKTVTKVLNQTLEEGMKTIADLKGVGIDPSRARTIVSQADALGKVAGRTGQEMIGLGLQGAEMFRGTGVTMGIGFQASQMNLAAVRAARDFGTLSQEAIAQAGGEESLAMRMTAGGLSFAQSSMGRGMGAAFFQPGAAGGLNTASFMQNMMAGGGNFLQMVQQGASNLASPSRLIEYQANQEKFMSQMGQQFGGRGLEMAMLGSTAAYAEYMAGGIGDMSQRQNFFRLALKQQGKSTAEIEAYMAQIKDPTKMFQTMQEGIEATSNKMKIDEANENFVLTRMGSAVGDQVKRMVDVVARPLNAMIDDVAGGMQTFTREQMFGAIQGSARGVNLNVRFEATDAEREANARRRGAINMNQGGTFARTAGEQLANTLSDNPELAKLLGAEVKYMDPSKAGANDVILRNAGAFGFIGAFGMDTRVATMSQANLDSVVQKARVYAMTDADAKRLEESGRLKDIKGNGLLEIFSQGKAGRIQSGTDVLEAMFGKEAVAKGVSEEQMAFAIQETRGTGLADALDKMRLGAQKIGDAGDNSKIFQLKAARDQFDEGKRMLEKRGDIKLADGVAELLAKANEANKKNDPEGERNFIAQAKTLQAKKTGGNIGEIDTAISKAYAGNQMALENVKMGVVGMQDVQQLRGASTLSRSVESALFSEEGVKLDERTRNQISDAAAMLGTGRVADIKNVLADKEMVGSLKKLGIGAAAVEQLQGITGMEEKLKGVKDDKELREVLKGTFKDEKQLVEMMQLYKSEGKSAVVDEALKSFQQNMTTQGGIASASGQGSTSGDPNAQNAGQMAQVQTSINLQTLAAMQGLAKKLGVN